MEHQKLDRQRLERILTFVIIVLFSIGSGLATWLINNEQHRQLIIHERKDSEELRSSLIASCERVNILRASFNKRGEAILGYIDGEITVSRAILANPKVSQTDKIYARLNLFLLQETASAFVNIPTVDCRNVIDGVDS